MKHQPWDLTSALLLIHNLAPSVRELDYHLCLGGGVLNKGVSEKDLDLWFLPLNGYDSEPKKIIDLLILAFGSPNSIRDSPDYAAGDPWHLKDALWFEFQGKRIDCFIQ